MIREKKKKQFLEKSNISEWLFYEVWAQSAMTSLWCRWVKFQTHVSGFLSWFIQDYW